MVTWSCHAGSSNNNSVKLMTINKLKINFSFQTTGVEVSVKSVNIPETSDSVVSFCCLLFFFLFFFVDIQVYLPLFQIIDCATLLSSPV